MNRRPTTREGAIAPKFTLAAVVVLAAGVACVASDQAFGWWLIAPGGVGVATAGLVFWRLMQGALVAAPLWVLLASALALRVGAPGSVAGWGIAAGVLLLVSLLLIGVNRPISGAVTAALWLEYAGFGLRALPDGVQARQWWPAALVAGVLVFAATVVSSLRARSSSRGVLRRLGRAGRVTDGMASAWDVWKAASARSLRRKATVLRPSLKDLSRRARRKLSITELGTAVAKVGLFKVHVSPEDSTLSVGGPRVGKTGALMGRVLDAPGAVIATSTRTDILNLTGPFREKVGPVWVFDPSGITEAGSTITFNPLQGCADPGVVMERAADLIAGVGGKDSADGERWDMLARQALTAVMHAAALGGYSMRDVQRWIANPDAKAKELVLFELRNADAFAFVQMASQFFDNNERTRSSISTTVMPALAWLSNPTAAAAAAPGGTEFDVAKLLARHGTVYLLGKANAQIGPLVTALTAHIAREARAIAARMPSQRLDPQLTLVLDEAALICLIPLDEWTADMGGFNITIHISAQSRAQLRQRFGEAAAGAMISNVATVLLFGGMKDTDDLQAWSTLTGDREESVATKDRDSGTSSVTNRRVPVLTAAQIAQLKPSQVLIISRSMPPSIGRVQMAWTRPDVRRLARQARNAKRLAAFEAAVDRWGWRCANAHARLFDHGALDLKPVEAATRPVRRATAARLAAGLEWLEANNPARAAVAWLTRAMRKARAALAARAPAAQLTEPGAGTEPSDADRGQR